jgi:hypothetical protein
MSTELKDEKIENEEKATGSRAEENIVQKLAELKQNSVSKEEYERVLNLNKDLVDHMMNDQKVEQNVQQETNYDDIIKSAQEKLFTQDGTINNLEYCSTALQLRDAILAKTGEDIFVAKGHKISPDETDYEKAENVAQVLREVIEYADGDSEIFTVELQRRTDDVALLGKRKR